MLRPGAHGSSVSVCCVLCAQDAADRKRLHASTFQTLNVGVGALATTQAVLLAVALRAGYASPILTTYATIGTAATLAGLAIYNFRWAAHSRA